MTKLVISLATRGRPGQVVDTIRKSICNLSHPNTELYVQADEDDKETIAAVDLAFPDHKVVKLCVKPREDTIAAKWNRALAVSADLYLVAADDDPYCSPDYDRKLLDAALRFPDGIGMVYGHMANLSFTGVVASTRAFTEKLGYIFPEYFPYWFVDHWTDDVAKMIGRISFADVRTDQSRAGKTQEMREPGWWATWYDAAYLMRRRIAISLIDGFDQSVVPFWQRDMLQANFNLIDQRSRGVNETVRQQARQLEGWSGLTLQDARYQRVKQRAIDMIPSLLIGMEPAEAEMFQRALIVPTTIPNLLASA